MKHRISAVGLGTVNWLTRKRCKIFCLRAAIWRSLTILEILRIHAPSSTCQLNHGTHRSLNTKGSSQPLYQAVYSTNPHWQENTRAPLRQKSPTGDFCEMLYGICYIVGWHRKAVLISELVSYFRESYWASCSSLLLSIHRRFLGDFCGFIAFCASICTNQEMFLPPPSCCNAYMKR